MKKIIIAIITCMGMMILFAACSEEPVNQFVGEWEPKTVLSVSGDDYFMDREEVDVTSWFLGELGSAYGPVTITNDGSVSIEMEDGNTLSYQWKDDDNGEDNFLDLEGIESDDDPLGRSNINYDPEKDQIILVFDSDQAFTHYEVSYSRK